MPLLPRLRRVIARRPWIQWFVIVSLALALGAAVEDAVSAVERERDAWGESVTVWIATSDTDVGDVVDARSDAVPVAIRPERATGTDPTGSAARQAIGRGDIVTDLDVMPPDDELALVPDGWLVAPLRQSTPSGAGLGDAVLVASDGFVVAEGLVVGFVDDVTLVAVPAVDAPLVPAAAETARVTLLRVP